MYVCMYVCKSTATLESNQFRFISQDTQMTEFSKFLTLQLGHLINPGIKVFFNKSMSGCR